MQIFKKSILNTLILCLALSVVVSSCKKDDDPLEPRISQLSVCNEPPADEILCASNVSTFAPTDPAVYASAKFDDITKDTDVTFTLFGVDTDGDWEELSTFTFKPSELGTFEDETSFDLSTNFTRNQSQNWQVNDYKVEAKVEVDNGPTASKEFDVQ